MEVWEFLVSINIQNILLVAGQRIAQLIIVFIIATIINKSIAVILEKALLKSTQSRLKIKENRAKSLAVLSKSITFYVIYFIAAIMALELIGLQTAPLVATAGLASFALGFGAQNLVRDVLTGFFIIFEDQYDIGDHVSLAGVTGLVEEMGLRVTKIRDFGGQLHIIPNGKIEQATNHMGEKMRVLVDVQIAYEISVDKSYQVLEELFENLPEDIPEIVESPQILGVQELDDSGVTIRIAAKAMPLKQWAVERKLRKFIKDAFDKNNVEIPYPRRYVIFEHIDKKEINEDEAI